VWNLVFLFTGLIFIILLLVIFLSKPKIKTKENKMFLVLSVLNLIGYIIEIALQIFVRKCGIEYFAVTPLSKLYIMYIFVWFSIFSIYTFLISNSSGKLSDYSYKIIKYTHITAIILGIIGIGIMPIEKYYSNGEMYTYGMSVNFLKIMLGVYIIIWIFRLLLNFRTIKEKKYYSIIITILLLFANIVFQSINPAILIATFTMTYTCYIIFFTIENPDIRMAKELAFANEQIKRKKDNTINVLNDLSSKLQNSLSKLETFGYKKTDINNVEEMAKDLKYIKKYCINFVDKVNGLIDISKINSGDITINEDEYETKNFIDEIEKLINKKLIIKRGKLPSVLYGDKGKIKQVIILMYKYLSSKGNIDVELDYVVVGRFCKLKFNFVSNDIDIHNYIYGIKNYGIKDDNFVFYEKKDNIEYDKIMKIISLIDAGTEINGYKDGSNELVLSIYQKIKNPYKVLEEKEENKGIKVRYFNLSSKRILLVDDGINNIREMLLLLKPYKVSVDVAKNFDDLRKYLVSNKTYDLIFIDDVIYGVDSEEYSVEMYERLTGYNSFKTIIMLSNDKEKNISEYLGKGYVDFIIKPLNKRNINEVLKKHLK
jgi:CheY-like chemotaxis protein